MPTTGGPPDVRETLSAEDLTLEQLHELRREIHCRVELRDQVERFLEEFDGVAKKLSSENKARIRRAAILWLLDRNGEAISLLEGARAGRERSYLLGLCHLEEGRAGRAVGYLREALEADESDPLVASACGEAEILAGSLEEAQSRVERLLKKGGGADAWYLKGLLADVQGEREAAQAAYEKALEVDPGHAKSLFRLAYLTDLRGEDDRALELYEQLRKMRPVHLHTVMNLGVLYEDRGEYEKAVRCFQSVLDYFPGHPRALLYLKDARASMTMFYDEEAARREAKLQQVLAQPVAEIAFSPRVRAALQKLSVTTLGDLVQKTEEEMLALPNFGRTSLREVKEFLSSKGLSLTVTGKPVEEGPQEGAEAAGASGGMEVLQRRLDEFEWSPRIRKVFEKLGLNTVSDLLQKTEKDLLKGKSLGEASLREIRKKLGQFGLAMRPEE